MTELCPSYSLSLREHQGSVVETVIQPASTVICVPNECIIRKLLIRVKKLEDLAQSDKTGRSVSRGNILTLSLVGSCGEGKYLLSCLFFFFDIVSNAYYAVIDYDKHNKKAKHFVV